jgi:hypothetical protein
MFASQTPALAGRKAKADQEPDQQQVKSEIKINSRAGLARQSKVLRGKAPHTTIASLASAVASSGRFAPVLARSCSPW